MFKDCLKKALYWEGTYSNHPADRGGETYKGIARNLHPTWAGWGIIDLVKSKKGGKRALRAGDISSILGDEAQENLESLVEEFYKKMFWKRVKGDKLAKIDGNLACNVFDLAVNAGRRVAVKVLQRAINRYFRELGSKKRLVEDGILGKMTLGLIKQVDIATLIKFFKLERSLFYIRIVKRRPSQIVFLSGWSQRALLV